MDKVFCIKCGTQNVPEANFCYKCGAKIQNWAEFEEDVDEQTADSVNESSEEEWEWEDWDAVEAEKEQEEAHKGFWDDAEEEDDWADYQRELEEQEAQKEGKEEEPAQRDDRTKLEDEVVDCALYMISLSIEEMITQQGSSRAVEAYRKEKQEIYEVIEQKLTSLFDVEEDIESGLEKLCIFKELLEKNSDFKEVLGGFCLYTLNEEYSTIGQWMYEQMQRKFNLFIEFLEELSDRGYGRASYILSRCYGSGVIAISADDKPYVIEADYQKEKEYLEKAKGQKDCPVEVYMDLGSCLLRDGLLKEAQGCFEYLREQGIEEGNIYLRYIDCLRNQKEVVESYRSFEDTSEAYKGQKLRGNFLEYKGFLYYYVAESQKTDYGNWTRDDKKHLFIKQSLSDGSKKVLLEESGREYSLGYYDCICMRPLFMIHDDLIYYSDGNGNISCMDLDGGKRQVLIARKRENDWNFAMPIMFSDHLFFNKGYDFCEYDRAAEKAKKICSFGLVRGISEKEILIDGKTMKILNLDTYEKKSVQQVYTGLKGKKLKNLLYVDMALEIAYYFEDNGSYAKNRIVGINKAGDITDIWRMPRIPADILDDLGMSDYYDQTPRSDHRSFPYATLSFNGQKMALKMQHTEYDKLSEVYKESDVKKMFETEVLMQEAFVCEFDRMGNKKVIERKPYFADSAEYGAFLAMSGDMVTYLECNIDNKQHEKLSSYWSMAQSMKTSEKIVLEFYT